MDVAFDYGAFPVWAWITIPAHGGRPSREVVGSVSPEWLSISAKLATELRAWSDWMDLHSEYGGGRAATDEQYRAWAAQGRKLAQQLAEETGAEVVYQGDRGEIDLDCPHCGRRG
ncbi:hypothetical protein ACFHW0_07295 [Micromonospora sp. LOL_025]|uniref:hypothetical protein n=1 Tax=Micromonospora sp. LOL_025 TaxID=3345413 RepID=UPI003A837A60